MRAPGWRSVLGWSAGGGQEPAGRRPEGSSDMPDDPGTETPLGSQDPAVGPAGPHAILEDLETRFAEIRENLELLARIA